MEDMFIPRCMLCNKEVLNPVECPNCEAIHYCSIKHLKLDREQAHSAEACRRSKSQMAPNMTIHRDIPFPWYPKHAHSSKCILFKELEVHKKGAWVRECFCSQNRAYGLDAPLLKSLWKKNKAAQIDRATLAERLEDDEWWAGVPEGKQLLMTSLPPPAYAFSSDDEDAPAAAVAAAAAIEDDDGNPPVIESWEQYCTQRKIPLTSPLPTLLDMPLTVYWAIQKLKKQFDGVLPMQINIAIVGVEKEIDQWPLFLELGALLPAQDLTLHFIGPEIPIWADNCSITVPHLHGCGGTFKTSAASATAPDGAASQKQKLERDHERFFTKIHFHATFLENVLQSRLRRADNLNINLPDIIVGLNAGLGAYPTWISSLMAARQSTEFTYKPELMLFTDYVAESVWVSKQNCNVVFGRMSDASLSDIEINPFRKPTWVKQAMYSMPYCSNGFGLWVAFKEHDDEEEEE